MLISRSSSYFQPLSNLGIEAAGPATSRKHLHSSVVSPITTLCPIEHIKNPKTTSTDSKEQLICSTPSPHSLEFVRIWWVGKGADAGIDAVDPLGLLHKHSVDTLSCTGHGQTLSWSTTSNRCPSMAGLCLHEPSSASVWHCPHAVEWPCLRSHMQEASSPWHPQQMATPSKNGCLLHGTIGQPPFCTFGLPPPQNVERSPPCGGRQLP